MSLHPIVALDQIIQEYRDYVLTEFRAKDKNLRNSLEEALGSKRFLAQEPFYQAHRPFRAGKKWTELPIDGKLAGVMIERARKHGSPTSEYSFSHQSDAISELLSPNPRPTVVTTGTGSGKTEAFLLPVIQNAIEDAVQFKKSGLTAVLVYPMNALANDQLERIRDYLKKAGFEGAVSVEQYDRSTSQTKREEMRRSPPHILLTNYMMLEYLLVRPADRDAIFANHRCKFLVLDEVHTYRGTLGSNIAFLVRRLRAHLRRAKQDWIPNPTEPEAVKRRYPILIPVGTSATIKSVSGKDISRAEAVKLRNEAVQDFFSKLTAADKANIQVFGESVQDLEIPADAKYSDEPADVGTIDISNPESVRTAICRIAGVDSSTPLPEAVRKCRMLWDINRLLISAPMSLSQIMKHMKDEVPQRKDADDDALRKEIENVLVAGAALPDGILGALRLRAHRFIRGGWKFHRCLNPNCGRLYPMGQEQCSKCGYKTAPLHLCRHCGADYLQLVGDPNEGTLRPASSVIPEGETEWVIYEASKFDDIQDSEDGEDDDLEEDAGGKKKNQKTPAKIKKREILSGSIDPATLSFSGKPDQYPVKAMLVPGRKVCMCCGGRSGSRNVITPVSLGTSAALKVLTEGTVKALDEAHTGEEGYDGKNRILIFSDSRQDAAHQARFIVFACRYDRMRRNLYNILGRSSEPVSLQRAVELLGEKGIKDRDNQYAPADPEEWIAEEKKKQIQIWEEAPLLDDISVTAGYRATLVNLGLLGVHYHQLGEYIKAKGSDLAGSLGLSLEQFHYLCRCFLDAVLHQGALSREMLRYHPMNPGCPSYIYSAEWERGLKSPKGLPASKDGEPVLYMDDNDLPKGIVFRRVWRRENAKGQGPALEKMVKKIVKDFGGNEPSDHDMLGILKFLKKGTFIVLSKLFGAQKEYGLYQINHEIIWLKALTEANRRHCSVCGTPRAEAEVGYPCPNCRGKIIVWQDSELENNRIIERIKSSRIMSLQAKEHTAQVPNSERAKIEHDFKAGSDVSKVNVLACSPTLEMGIDVGGLDAVAMRNIPPRPDNYAQRGGRAGRRSRVGLVLGYARSTPHDQYFYDNPAEMISGEIPAPALALYNRDVLLRHIYAIAFGSAEPGLAGRMLEYVSPDGNMKEDKLKELIEGVKAQFQYTVEMSKDSFGEIAVSSGLDEEGLLKALNNLPERIRDIIERTARQVLELRQALDAYAMKLTNKEAGIRAATLTARILGIPQSSRPGADNADDRSSGYPLRRFAEAGILPGYEFPVEPASLRLQRDPNEDEAITVGRQFGIAQFQPSAQVYARTKRWRVIGLDTSSPWNPKTDAPSLVYRVCRSCGLRVDAQRPQCPRCHDAQPNQPLQAYAYGGFMAVRDENPVLSEEDRIPGRNSVMIYPQHNGEVAGRWKLASGWQLILSKNEEVLWLNEGAPVMEADRKNNALRLTEDGKGFMLCGLCGSILTMPDQGKSNKKGRRSTADGAIDYGHRKNCPNISVPPHPIAISTTGRTEILRLVIPVPAELKKEKNCPWAMSLGYALRNGLRHFYMLDGSEIEFEIEGPWIEGVDDDRIGFLSLTFIDPSIGGTGYLVKAANDFHLIAQRTIEHLKHEGCETACYRCLKTYANQRYHDSLSWPLTLPYLEVLASSAPESLPLQKGDTFDPKPWLEAYKAGVGSPLELKFLKLFEKYGFHPEKQLPVSVNNEVNPISIADFAVKDKRIAIYIDGASVHVGRALRRDRYIRDRLRKSTPPWTVIELMAKDLNRAEEIVKDINQLA
jgi:hypothetical protein